MQIASDSYEDTKFCQIVSMDDVFNCFEMETIIFPEESAPEDSVLYGFKKATTFSPQHLQLFLNRSVLF